ncbi:hypothetical protein DSO57_1001464 [Entomophthora muscae]|uniref:Uncharacterized protein n=1 Tax=Entomophthora muscae TaxID=34485 RepID=A0ACC2UIK2_9FUNG|nr:hypothetical protein DSO57_1001464 [Entomophthora muscae]
MKSNILDIWLNNTLCTSSKQILPTFTLPVKINVKLVIVCSYPTAPYATFVKASSPRGYSWKSLGIKGTNWSHVNENEANEFLYLPQARERGNTIHADYTITLQKVPMQELVFKVQCLDTSFNLLKFSLVERLPAILPQQRSKGRKKPALTGNELNDFPSRRRALKFRY